MTAIRFWDQASDKLKRNLCDRAGVPSGGEPGDEQCTIDLPFWHLPAALKAVIYESIEFRHSERM